MSRQQSRSWTRIRLSLLFVGLAVAHLSLKAEFPPRSMTPDNAGGIYGPVGICADGDYAIGITMDGRFMCAYPEFHPNPRFKWS